ncbi:alkaline phosphatase synthesis sensor protein PhoR [Candidatus Termititenax persephonae]|uniref:histidine kinase n=1 Tax=Candidatus Termititenax persephonae TaxID=2218525 RepID=A0A388THH9_9BACT|nr:alkaline phosphatase synthesis sensor protein PhoR [Candidatus Termititenax persephonae]
MVIRRNIFHRLFRGFLLLVLALAAAIFLPLFFSWRGNSARLLGAEYQKYAEALADNFSAALERNDLTALREQAARQGQRTQWRITIINPAGQVLADTFVPPETMENHLTRPEFILALRGASSYDIRYSQTLGADFLYAAAPLVSGGKISGALRLSLSLRRVALFFWPLIRTAFFFTLILLGFLFLLAFRLLRRFSLSLDSLEQAAWRAAGGDLTARVNLPDADEFKTLAGNFNKMSEQLGASLAQINSQKAELAALVDSLPHGLLVVGRQGLIRLSNKSLRQIVGTDELAGHYYWEIFRGEEFAAWLRPAEQTPPNALGELTRDGRSYAVATAQLPNEDLAIVLQDTTETRELERIKRDFVANAAHELRTPLTAIKGFAETLADEASAEQKHYLEVIKKNAERLISIVRDIMVLSELEARGGLEKEKINLKNLLEDLSSIFAARLAAKGLTFAIIEETPVELEGDAFRLQQAFSNLIDNAVKYTEKGGVLVRLAKTKTQAVIAIEDTGVGIPAAEQGRIFERFYVVDKSRARQLGGTGLGLSIVKHIVLLHHGALTVESSPRGSKFVIALPL